MKEWALAGPRRVRSPSIEIVVEAGEWPPEKELQRLAERAAEATFASLKGLSPRPGAPSQGGRESALEISVLLTNDEGMRRLNKRYRRIDAPTNVLSFPPASGPHSAGPLLGDVVLAAETVRRQAALAEKALEEHMAHLLVHGVLHLLGYDHEAADEAEEMEELERVALRKMGIADPYAALQDK